MEVAFAKRAGKALIAAFLMKRPGNACLIVQAKESLIWNPKLVNVIKDSSAMIALPGFAVWIVDPMEGEFFQNFVQLNVSLLHCFCVLFNSFAKLYTHFWPFTSTSGGKIILQTLVVVITATSVCKMIFSILQPLVAVITATSVCNYSH